MEPVFAMVAASAAPAPPAAAAAMLFAAGMACFELVRRVCRRPRCRQPLRRCPLCKSAAVGVLEYEIVGEHVRVLQKCGQCGVWREIVTALSAVARHERTLEADRMQILRCVERLERGRTVSKRSRSCSPRSPGCRSRSRCRRSRRRAREENVAIEFRARPGETQSLRLHDDPEVRAWYRRLMATIGPL